MDVLSQIKERLYAGDDKAIAALAQQALSEGLGAQEVLQNGLIAGMDRVGKDFRDGELFVPEVLMCAKAMQAGLGALRPLLDQQGVKSIGTCVIGSVKGDIHDIGKSLVGMMMEGAGFQVVDLGVDVSAERFVEAVQKHQPVLLGMSSLLTTTMEEMGVVLKALKAAGVRDRVKVIVGGAPVTANYATEIGADGYAPNAGAAVEKSKQILSLA
jgi:5-methyltetrahydrofolate--homocysteine methyltransferase